MLSRRIFDSNFMHVVSRLQRERDDAIVVLAAINVRLLIYAHSSEPSIISHAIINSPSRIRITTILPTRVSP
uniref:Uncharacterized protein n=1 Tax=Picea sitchensis TaxID=3332 RepID=A0A6B9XYN3_PICSI|nr:hypothetical protein Q903MT_gene5773 [Picea sitchensis]